jgi:hypothetical protein
MGDSLCSLILVSLDVNAIGHKAQTAKFGLCQLNESLLRASLPAVGMKKTVRPRPVLSHQGLVEILDNGLRGRRDGRCRCPVASSQAGEQHDDKPNSAVPAHCRLRRA